MEDKKRLKGLSNGGIRRNEDSFIVEDGYISNVEVELPVKVEVDFKGKARLVIPYGCKHLVNVQTLVSFIRRPLVLSNIIKFKRRLT